MGLLNRFHGSENMVQGSGCSGFLVQGAGYRVQDTCIRKYPYAHSVSKAKFIDSTCKVYCDGMPKSGVGRGLKCVCCCN